MYWSIGNNVFINLLFGGKNIAQTFYANSATRLHPAEWNTGIAAGVTAQYMIMNNIKDTKIVYNQIDKLQNYLKSDVIQQPLDWSWESVNNCFHVYLLSKTLSL